MVEVLITSYTNPTLQVMLDYIYVCCLEYI